MSMFRKMTKSCAALLLAGALPGLAQNALAARAQAPAPLYPIQPLIAGDRADHVYPSAAGGFIVYTRRDGVKDYGVERLSVAAPDAGGKRVPQLARDEAIRYGVALADGAIGYVSNRLGPISAWMWQAHGDGHVAIANMAVFRGALAPMHLNASRNGRVWCFDTTFEKKRYNQLLNEFAKLSEFELIGQQWRLYDSDNYRYKTGYRATQAGRENKFRPPMLFVFDRKSSQLSMLPNAFDGALSPDGRRIAFVRETNGNYDIWMQDVDGSELVQLTSNPYGDFEPAWSPDGRKLAFVSNRDSKGDVRATSIYVLDIDSGAVTRVTNAPEATDGGPTWLDAHAIAFHTNRDLKKPQARTAHQWNIWRVDLGDR